MPELRDSSDPLGLRSVQLGGDHPSLATEAAFVRRRRKPVNPITVRRSPVQAVRPDGTWEAQIVCDIDDFGLIREDLQRVQGGTALHVRASGDVLEVFAIHDTRTAAEGTARAWQRVVDRLMEAGGR